MILMFPHDDQIFRLEIQSTEKVMEGHIGYRKDDKILLRKDVFDELIYSLKNDDFPAIRNIMNQLIDFNSCDLPWEHAKPKEITYDTENIDAEGSGRVRYPVPAIITRFTFGCL